MIIPCKECISFAICKQRIRQELDPPDVTTFSKWINCDRVVDYIDYVKSHNTADGQNREINKARKLFGLPKVGGLKYPTRELVVVDKKEWDGGVLKVVSINMNDCNTLESDINGCEQSFIGKNDGFKLPR